MTLHLTTLPERVGAAYQQLSSVASDLNKISDELGKSVAEIDGGLKKLNLGVEVWVMISTRSGKPEENDFTYYNEFLGYAKVDATWGIALKTESGDERFDESTIRQWLFNDGPRTLRLASIGRLPDLLEELSKEAVRTTALIKNSLVEVQLMAGAVVGAAKPAPVVNTARSPFAVMLEQGAKGGKK